MIRLYTVVGIAPLPAGLVAQLVRALCYYRRAIDSIPVQPEIFQVFYSQLFKAKEHYHGVFARGRVVQSGVKLI